MNKTLFPLILLVLVHLTCSAQDDFRKSFESFKQRNAEDYQNFTDYSKRDFAESLAGQWERFSTFRNESRLKVKPGKAPHAEEHAVPEADVQMDISDVPVDEAANGIAQTDAIAMFINSGSESFEEKEVSFDFYGNRLTIDIPAPYEQFEMSGISEKAVSKAWELFESYGNSKLLSRLVKFKSQLNLNDWGVYELVRMFADEVFKYDRRLATVCAVNVMNHLGLDVRMARLGNALIPIFSAKQTIYSCNYIEMDGMKYYLPDNNGKKSGNIYTYRCQPSSYLTPLDMKIGSAPNFNRESEVRQWHSDILKKEIRLGQDTDLIDFYGNYPHMNLDIYARCLPSELFSKQILKEIAAKVGSAKDADCVNLLLKLMHYDFQYKTDIEQFSREKVFFVEENFFYDFNDCEDRSVLFSWLVRNLAGLRVAMLEYEDHVNCAVAVPGIDKGMYLNIRGIKYYVCDPTYIGASIGMSPKPAESKPSKIWLL